MTVTTQDHTGDDTEIVAEIDVEVCFGTAAKAVLDDVDQLTPEQGEALVGAQAALDQEAWDAADGRLCAVVDMLDPANDFLDAVDVLPAVQVRYAYKTVNAVVARDRGLITDADFALLTTPWLAAGLTLPAQITGDHAITADISHGPIEHLTSDLLADELLRTTYGTSQYGAMLALTGYNYGELLASPWVRRFIRRAYGATPADAEVFFDFDWSAMTAAFEAEEVLTTGPVATNGMDEVALNFLMTAADFAQDRSQLLDEVNGENNAEVYVAAAAHALGVSGMLDGCEFHVGEHIPVS